MDFKNKLGTVDAHNLNLNFKPENTDSHNIILNFEHLADGSTNLNFGDDISAIIDTVLETDFSFEATAIVGGEPVATGTGKSKREAEQAAARSAFAKISSEKE